ncbi:hypothetical protein DEAC_c31520 [Desulfosporosinus acididurans]|uniref:Uncharacterized protein n=1 Tax=Desulfosporosinus acididurans TaxID=476652 RepID=A0A0J1FMU8_9FIRM|nr:hypothetical protein DEAC_c31520 [Desulfosporosinus acididurans]
MFEITATLPLIEISRQSQMIKQSEIHLFDIILV